MKELGNYYALPPFGANISVDYSDSCSVVHDRKLSLKLVVRQLVASATVSGSIYQCQLAWLNYINSYSKLVS